MHPYTHTLTTTHGIIGNAVEAAVRLTPLLDPLILGVEKALIDPGTSKKLKKSVNSNIKQKDLLRH